MIFIITGTQKFPFDRLLKKVDALIEENIITDEVFGQIGASDYKPKNYQYKRFLEKEAFDMLIKNSSFIISHAGEGALMTCLINHKKVIAVPRYVAFGEHISDHQLMITNALEKMQHIMAAYDIKELESIVKNINSHKFLEYESQRNMIIQTICDFVER